MVRDYKTADTFITTIFLPCHVHTTVALRKLCRRTMYGDEDLLIKKTGGTFCCNLSSVLEVLEK
jgi:hypothetical protein